MKKYTFLFFAISSFFFISSMYFILVDTVAIPDRLVDRSYRQFMLRASKNIHNRIFIVSGSNSIHGIDAEMVENYFGRFTANLADNGEYPLEHKILNLKSKLSSGDIVLLPLEWQHYSYGDRYPDRYVRSIIDEYGSNSFYYRELPLVNKLQFTFKHLPFSLAMKRLFELNGLNKYNNNIRENERASLRRFIKLINENNRGSSMQDHSDDLVGPTKHQTCDEVVLPDAVNDLYISDRFIDNLKLLSNISRGRQIKFIFVWPSVAGKPGSECYSTSRANNIDKYSKKISSLINKYGFPVVGNYNESNFDGSCILNTYLHLRHSCGVIRTRKLIQQLEEIGVNRLPGLDKGNIHDSLIHYATKLRSEITLTAPLNILIEKDALSTYLDFGEGWSYQEDWGIWTIGHKSRISITTINKPDSIHFMGRYFNGEEQTKVWVNNKYYGQHVLKDFVLELDDKRVDSLKYDIVLEHSNPMKPCKVLERYSCTPGSAGDRIIKFGLNSIELNTSHKGTDR